MGHVDIGTGVEGDHVLEDKKGLVFLVTSVNCNFKVLLAYFLEDGITWRAFWLNFTMFRTNPRKWNKNYIVDFRWMCLQT